MDNNSFNAKEHWREFELLALRVVSIILEDILIYDEKVNHDLPLTRDHGIDGYLTFVMKNNNLEVTVEAKLRSKGKLSLKDFASSIVNYFINFSDIHFIITNVEFTDDATKIIDSINKRFSNYMISYYSGYQLKKIMNANNILQKHFPSIYQNLLNQNFIETPKLVKEDENLFEPKTYILTKLKKNISEKITNAINNDVPLITVEGEKGVGKSSVINEALKDIHMDIIDVNMEDTTSLRIFAIALIKSIVNIDIFNIIDMLSDDEKQEIDKDIDHFNKNKQYNYVKYFKQLLNIDLTNDVLGYIVKSFLKAVINDINKPRIIYVYNIDKSGYETISFLFQIIPIFLDYNITIIFEIPDILGDYSYLTDNEQNKIFKAISKIKSESKKILMIDIKEFDEKESYEFLSLLPLPNKNKYFLETIINKYGNNPSVLYNIADYIILNYISTAQEVNSMEINEYNLIKVDNLYNYIYARSFAEQSIIVNGLIVAYLSNNKINYNLIAKLGQKFKQYAAYKILIDTQWFDCKVDGLYIKKYISKKTLEMFSNLNVSCKLDCAIFLLENKSLLDGYIPERLYMECNLLYIINDKTFLQNAETALVTLKKLQCDSLMILLLDKCRIFAEKINTLSSIKYSVIYLETLEPESYFKESITDIINDINNKCTLIILSQNDTDKYIVYEYYIRLNIICYKKYRSIFNFFEAEKYIDKGLELENIYKNSSLMNRLYVYKALCIKERGLKNEFLEYFRIGIRKYPNESYIKICYCSNTSSYYFKRNRNRSRKYLKMGINLAEKNKHKSLAIWLNHNLLICNIYDTNYDYDDFDNIYDLRYKADKVGSIADISRSYNIEGCLLLASYKYDKSIKCFKHSIDLFDKNITEQMIFLFRTNLIVALYSANRNVHTELNFLYQWLLDTHSRIYKKLQSVPKLSYENNFAAIVSLIKVSISINDTFIVNELLNFFPFKELNQIFLENKGNNKQLDIELNNLVDTCYIKNNNILILF